MQIHTRVTEEPEGTRENFPIEIDLVARAIHTGRIRQDSTQPPSLKITLKLQDHAQRWWYALAYETSYSRYAYVGWLDEMTDAIAHTNRPGVSKSAAALGFQNQCDLGDYLHQLAVDELRVRGR